MKKRISKHSNYPPHHKEKSRHALAAVFILAVFVALVALGNVNSRENLQNIENTQSKPYQTQITGNVIDDPTKPNIIVIMVDDQPALDGRLLDIMPNTKSLLIDQGIKFVDFHSESPLCCPARVSSLTGQHTHNHGQENNGGNVFNNSLTLATQLQDEGYYTFLAGKYLNAYGSCKSKGGKQVCGPKVPEGWNRWAAFKKTAYYDYGLWVAHNNNTATLENYGSAPQNYSTDVIARKSVDFIMNAPAEQPIFAWIVPFSLHTGNTPAPRYASAECNVAKWKPANWNEADVSDKPLYVRQLPLINSNGGTSLTKECRGLLGVDDLVKNVTDALAATGRLNNSIIIYTGDNGMMRGEHRMKLGKAAPYETRVPFILRWESQLGTNPRISTERVQNIDLAPTLCEIVECSMEREDGISFLSLLYNPNGTLGRDAVLDEMPRDDTQAGGVPTWYSVITTSSSPLASQGCALASTNGCKWRYTEYPLTNESELYDLSNGPCYAWSVGMIGDPCELDNRASNPAYASIKAQLQIRLQELKAE